MNQVNSRSDHGHVDSTINTVVELLLIIIIIIIPHTRADQIRCVGTSKLSSQ